MNGITLEAGFCAAVLMEWDGTEAAEGAWNAAVGRFAAALPKWALTRVWKPSMSPAGDAGPPRGWEWRIRGQRAAEPPAAELLVEAPLTVTIVHRQGGEESAVKAKIPEDRMHEFPRSMADNVANFLVASQIPEKLLRRMYPQDIGLSHLRQATDANRTEH